MLTRPLKLAMAASIILAFPSISSATNLPEPEPADSRYYSGKYNWQGGYFGFSAGYGWGQSEQTYNRNDNHGAATTDPTGVLGALNLGYNYQFAGGIVVGAEADLGLMEISDDDKVVYDGHVYKTRFGPWWGSVRARLGFALGRSMIYATGGIAIMAVDEVSIGNTPGETAYNQDTRSGWVVGGGIEHAFTNQWSAKIEYLHMDFGTFNGFSANREDFTFENKIDLVRAGLNYKF